jgi:TrmH family RNA methyltransferase
MITSKQNSTVKLIRSLADKKNRDLTGLYIAEGVNTVNEAIKSGQKIDKIVATEKTIDRIIPTDREILIVSEEVFDYITNEVTPQGVMAIMVKPIVALESPINSCLFLDGVSDPANVGAIIRTAAASNYTEVYLADSADCYSPKSVRASMSGIFKIKAIQGKREDLLQLIDMPICVADMNGKSVFDIQMPKRFCLVIGNEARGVSQEVRLKAEITVSIPMENQVESLNAGVSAGILMYTLKHNK